MIHNSHPVQLIHGYLDVIGVGPKISNNSRLNLSDSKGFIYPRGAHKRTFIKLELECKCMNATDRCNRGFCAIEG